MGFSINLSKLSDYSDVKFSKKLSTLAHKIATGRSLRINQIFLEVVNKGDELIPSKKVIEGVQKFIKIAEEKGHHKDEKDLMILSEFCQRVAGQSLISINLECIEEIMPLKERVFLNEMQDWSNFVIRDRNWDHLLLYKTKGTQEPYGRRIQQAVTVLTDLIKDNKHFLDIMQYAATLRFLIAKDLDHVSVQGFGRTRIDPYSTELWGVYQELNTFWENKKSIIDKNNPLCVIDDKGGIQIIGVLGNQKIKLSYICPYQDSRISHFHSLHHTSADEIPTIIEHVADLYLQAQAENDPSKIIETAGEMFWWICQAKPWERGDPSIAEIIFRSLFAVKEIPNSPWKPGIIPWAEAMKDFDPKEFGRRFSSLFEI